MTSAHRSLVSLLASRKNCPIPKETHVLHPADWSFETDKYRVISLQNRPDLHPVLKKYMVSTFYREAPIPVALNLTKENCQSTHDYVMNEIDLGLKSGCSTIYIKPPANDILSIRLNLIWQRDDKYKVIGADAKLWHNAAAEVIDNDPEIVDRHLIWRNYQFQHIYDMGQNLLKKAPKKKYALYLNTGYITPELRRSGSTLVRTVNRLDDYHRHWNLTDCVIYFASTISKANVHIQNQHKNYTELDYVSYAEEELVIDGKKCFEPFTKLGGITYYVDYLKDFEF